VPEFAGVAFGIVMGLPVAVKPPGPVQLNGPLPVAVKIRLLPQLTGLLLLNVGGGNGAKFTVTFVAADAHAPEPSTTV